MKKEYFSPTMVVITFKQDDVIANIDSANLQDIASIENQILYTDIK